MLTTSKETRRLRTDDDEDWPDDFFAVGADAAGAGADADADAGTGSISAAARASARRGEGVRVVLNMLLNVVQ
ncbi:hypothetical protein GCM10027020_33380 [Nocardioides salsibiostraticola]